jgi:hypothetical protein
MLSRIFEKRKTLKITMISIAGFLLLSFVGIDTSRISGRCSIYIEDYSEFYFYKREAKQIFSFGFPGSGSGPIHQLWFLPFQRGRMQERIREDVIAILENAMENNSDIIEQYEISNDFRKIYIYFNNTWEDRLERDIPVGSIPIKVELYHQLIHGRFVELSSIMNYVDAEEPLHKQ